MIINDFFTNPKRSARNVTENSQRVDSLVTDALRVMQGPTVSDAVLALKRVLGDREYNGRRGFYSFYVDQILDMYGQQNLAEGADDYLDSDPATGTGDETHELDTRPLTQDPDADYNDMMQPMEAADDYPSPADVAASMSNNTDNGPDIMRNWDRFGKNLKPDQEITPLDSEEEEAVKNHIDRWQAKIKNLPDPFAGPTIYKGADGSEFSAGGSGDAAPGSSATAVDTVAPVQSTAKLADLNRPPEDWIRLLGSDPFAASRAAAAGSSNAWPAGMTNREYTKQAGLGAASSEPAQEPDANRRLNANGLMAADDFEQYMKGLVAAEKQKQKVDGSDNRFARQGKPAVTYDPFGVEIPDTSTRKIAPASKTTAPAAPAAASKTTAPLWQAIAQANKIANPNLIYPGQEIKLPNGRSTIVDKGDTLSSIASKYRQGFYNDGTPASQPRKTSVKETDVGNTMDDGFKWGTASMPMQDGSTMQYHAPTNSYKQATPPTRPDLNTNMSTITRDRATDKNGQVNQNYSDVSIATNPATGTGDYMHRQDVNGTPTTTFRQNVPAAELAKLRSQHFNEDINRMRSLAGIRKK